MTDECTIESRIGQMRAGGGHTHRNKSTQKSL